jgi:hypothetical protein
MNPAQGFTTVAPYVGLYKNSSGADRLAVPMTWGWVLYSLASPAYPSLVSQSTGGGIYDTRWDSNGVGPPHQDGQSFGPGYAISADGQRILNSCHLSHAETVVSVPNPLGETVPNLAFLSKGDTLLQDAKLAVQHKGGRYIAYGLVSSGTMFAADVTTLTSFSQSNPIPFGTGFSLGSSAQSLAIAEGTARSYLYSFDAAGAIVVDVTNPGAAGSITSGFSRVSIPTGVFGLPGQNFLSVSAAVDPANGKLYVLGSFQDGQGVPSFGLVLYDPGTSQATFVNKYTAPFEAGAPTFNASGGSGTVAVNPSGDVWTFMWVKSASLQRYRLYASMARTFGSPIGQSAEISGPGGYLTGTAILFGSQSNAYAYFLDGAGPWAAGLSCQSGPVAATASLGVTNTSTGQPVASGATVFVGDTLTVSPSVAPSNAVQTVTGWNLDLDYHSASEHGAIGVMQLLNPDACLNGCNNAFNLYPDPPAFPLVGPCEFRNGGVPATGTGCWNSVGPVSSGGNGDFLSLQPAAGTTATLPIAFEAANQLNSVSSLATFNVVWKVPVVRVQILSALLNAGSATFTDGSEGHPVATGYRWYFGQDNTGPASEVLVLDSSCTGPTCNHVFGLGKGTYNAWLTASYKNEYQSPDCINPCGGAAGSFKVTVTDFVASFTAPSNAIVSTSMTVTNNSQIGGGVTGISYLYTLCNASSGSCTDPGNYQPIAGMGGPTTSGTIPAPATQETWWLRIKATYNGTSEARWQPNVVSDQYAWPISVTTTPPVITPTAGFDYCVTGGCTQSYTGTVGTPITVILMLGSTQVTGGIQWTASGAGANPSSFIGSSFTFTPTTTGPLIVSVPGASPAVTPIGFLVSGGGGGGTALAVSVSASNPSPTVGTAITLTASPSGGTAPYTSYDWNFGDGFTVSGGSSTSPPHSYSTSGSKSVSCTVHDSAAATATGGTTVNVQTGTQQNALLPISGFGNCSLPGCPSPYTGTIGTAITVGVFQGTTQQFNSYSWTVTGVNATPSTVSGFSTITFTPTGPGTARVTNTTLGGLFLDIAIPAPPPPPTTLAPISGCTLPGCPSPYTGALGTDITVGVFQGTTQLFGNYLWTVSGIPASPQSAGSGPNGFATITFKPLAGGTATVTNTTLGLSLSITISGPQYAVYPTTGYGSCTAGCPAGVSYTGSVGTPITVGAFDGANALSGSYSWTVTGVGANPSTASGSTITFTPLGPGTAVITNTTLNVSVNISISGPQYALVPTSGFGICTTGCPAGVQYTGAAGTPITVAVLDGGAPKSGSFNWTVTGVNASPPAVSGFSTITFTPLGPGTAVITTTVNSVPLSLSIAISGPQYALAPSEGSGGCTPGCPAGVQYTGTTGTRITVAVYEGGAPKSGSFNWTVTGVNANPSSVSGASSFTFTPTSPGTAVITTTVNSVSLSLSIQIQQALIPEFILSDGPRGAFTPGGDGIFLVVRGRTTAFTAVWQGSTTQIPGTVSWNFGDGSTSNSNPANKTYFQEFRTYTVSLTYGPQKVNHTVYTVLGVPTAAYASYPFDGGAFNPNQVDVNRPILFQADSDTARYATNFSWNFGDGTPAVSGPDKANVTHAFAAPGSYTVILTAALGTSTSTTALPQTFVVSNTSRWVVPGLAYASGVLPGSFYVSDVVIQNPSTTQPMGLSLALADGTAPASMTWKTLQLQPMESRVYNNILKTLFGWEITDVPPHPATALIVRGDSLPETAMPVIWATTYNNSGGDPRNGTFGVAIPAVPLSGAVSSVSTPALTEFPGLRDVPDYATQVRNPLVAFPNVSPAYTNVGFVNPGDAPANVTLRFYSSRLDKAGQVGQKMSPWDVSFTVDPNSTRQFTQVLSRYGGWDPTLPTSLPADDYHMIVNVTNGGRVIPYTTVKDIGSSDSVFMTNDGSIASSYRLPAIVRAVGQNNAKFRSRVVLFNPSVAARSVILSYSFINCVSGTSTCDSRQTVSQDVPLLSGQAVVYEDFVKEWLAPLGYPIDTRDYTQSFLDVAPADGNTDPLLVRAEAYNATPSGNFGTQVPGLVASIHGASPATGGSGARLIIPRALPNGGTSGFRTNVALVLLAGATGTAKVRVYPDAGGLPALPEVSFTLTAEEPFLQRRLEQIFPAITPLGASAKYSLEILVTEGTMGAYASINDNITSDSTVLVARPQN